MHTRSRVAGIAVAWLPFACSDGGGAGENPGDGGTSSGASGSAGVMSGAGKGGGGASGASTGGTSGSGAGAVGGSNGMGGNGAGGAGTGGATGGAGDGGNGASGSGNAGGSAGEAAAGGTGGTSGSSGSAGTAGGGGSGGAPTGGCVPACGSHKWACWPMPNPIGSGLPNEASYTDNGESVTDDLTCLEWQKSAPEDTFDWTAALAYCDDLSLNGHDDWRLPTRIELTSIVDFTKSPAVDRSVFPDAGGGFHKTASDWILTIRQEGAGAGTDYAWAFNLSDGIVSNAYSKATAASLRCVRSGGEGEGPSEPAVAPPNLYTEIGEGEVQDNYTGLVWQAGNSEETMPFADAAGYCSSLGLNGHTWRLPSIREAATLVDEARVAQAIDVDFFPDTESGRGVYYWTSHVAVGRAETAGWGINFDDGFTGFNAGDSGAWNYFPSGWVRCVR
jgi:hypothetical protein